MTAAILLAGCGGSSTDNDTVFEGDQSINPQDGEVSTGVDGIGNVPADDSVSEDLEDTQGTGDSGDDDSDDPMGPVGTPPGQDDDDGGGPEMLENPETTEMDPDSTQQSASEQGIPGSPVDCNGMLPCLWRSMDGALTLTATSADSEFFNGSGRFRLDLAVNTTRDTELALLQASSVTSEDGQAFPSAREAAIGGNEEFFFGSTTSVATQLDASSAGDGGITVNGWLGFPDGLAANTTGLRNATVRMLDSGAEIAAVFTDLPVGRERTAVVDCANELPCGWESLDGMSSLTITALGPNASGGDLLVEFAVRSVRPSVVGSASATGAVGEEGRAYAAQSATLGTDDVFFSGNRVVSTLLSADVATPGTVRFSDGPGPLETGLQVLNLNVFEIAQPRVPRWNPMFRNVPITR